MLRLHNLTRGSLVPYPVVVTPPPPRRERDLSKRIPFGGAGPMDPAGFHPVFCSEQFDGPDTEPNGVHYGFDFSTVPGTVLARVFHYKAAPGQAGGDPALQPILLHQSSFDAGPDSDLTLDHNWLSALGRAEQPLHTLDAFPRELPVGQPLRFDAHRGVPGEELRLFTRRISGRPNSMPVAHGIYGPDGHWSHETQNPGNSELRPGNEVVLVASPATPAAPWSRPTRSRSPSPDH